MSPVYRRDHRGGEVMPGYNRCGRWKSGDWVGLKIVTVNLPEIDLEYIEMIIKVGFVPSRSEYVRVAVRNQINADIERINSQEGIINEEIRLDPERFVRVPGYNGNKPLKILRRLD